MPRLITGLDAARIRANLDRIRATIADAGRDPAEVEILAAVKYVALEEIGVLAEAGLTLLGENRAQELEAKATAHPEFRWHFIGQLQSRKVKSILPYVELIHSVASESALAQLGAPRRRRTPRSCSRSTSPARRARRASTRPSCRATSRRRTVRVDGADDDAAVRRRSRGQPPAFRPPARARRASTA